MSGSVLVAVALPLWIAIEKIWTFRSLPAFSPPSPCSASRPRQQPL